MRPAGARWAGRARRVSVPAAQWGVAILAAISHVGWLGVKSWRGRDQWGVAILAAESFACHFRSNVGVDMTTPGWKPTPDISPFPIEHWTTHHLRGMMFVDLCRRLTRRYFSLNGIGAMPARGPSFCACVLAFWPAVFFECRILPTVLHVAFTRCHPPAFLVASPGISS